MNLKDKIDEWWIKSEFTLTKEHLISIFILGILIISGWSFHYFRQPVKTSIKIENAGLSKIDKKVKMKSDLFYVHVAGAVINPGVYKLKSGLRIDDAIKMAGGFTSKANQDELNLAQKIIDSQKILVNIKGLIQPSTGSKISSDSLININSANEQQLDELPGIGETMAKRIVELRKEIGSFKSIDQLKDVEGIGEKKFAKIKVKVIL